MRENVTYFADGATGFFTSADGARLTPGYQVNIGLQNYQRFLTDPSFRGPLLRIFAWNVTFALLSVLFSFSLGLMISIVFGRTMPGQGQVAQRVVYTPFGHDAHQAAPGQPVERPPQRRPVGLAAPDGDDVEQANERLQDARLL